MQQYPLVKDVNLVGTYPALVKSGGGYVWDDVLEYRVWCHDKNGGDDYYYAFTNSDDALEFSEENSSAETPLALIVQEEYIDESKPGQFRHIIKQRLTEWPIEFLSRPKRSKNTIPDFLSPNAPDNRMDILRGIV